MAAKDGRQRRPRESVLNDPPGDMQVKTNVSAYVRVGGVVGLGVKGQTTHRQSMSVLAYALLVVVAVGAAFVCGSILHSYAVVAWIALPIVAAVFGAILLLGWLWPTTDRAVKKQSKAMDD